MGGNTKQPSPGLGTCVKQFSWILLTAQYTAFVLLLHYSRVMPPSNGKLYIASTAVFFNEVIKLAISLTIALYEVSKTAPPTVPATSLFFALTAAVFSGDSWKLAIPAGLYTIANTLQYIALSNLPAATFQVTYQMKLVVTTMPDGSSDQESLQDQTTHPAFPRSLEEWKAVKLERPNLHKRSATYEGIQEDIMTAFPRMNGTIGLLATIGSCMASGLASVYLEKVLKDSAKSTSLWVRNVQLAVYSVFPALFIGVIFLDGEKIAANGFFEGYNWAVWSTVAVQAVGGIAASFYIGSAYRDAKNVATATSITLSTLGSIGLFEFEPTANFLLGTFAVLVATYLYEDSSVGLGQGKRQGPRPPPIRIDRYEKCSNSDGVSPASASPPNEISIKLPGTPFLSDAGISTSRPTSPGHPRANSARNTSGGYFDKH
ncbi:hypothetical protein EYZ11_009639 [Aspergillus tanneri]|uniref:UDP-galactose transporter n=1 Tax=Aspergillus tanneri TaxID=1220188 RepID=A0A4S3J7K7_9EURO|nr:hypothetical protein EYZ11_009639 [Aspergillus tanneri]